MKTLTWKILLVVVSIFLLERQGEERLFMQQASIVIHMVMAGQIRRGKYALLLCDRDDGKDAGSGSPRYGCLALQLGESTSTAGGKERFGTIAATKFSMRYDTLVQAVIIVASMYLTGQICQGGPPVPTRNPDSKEGTRLLSPAAGFHAQRSG